MAEETLAELSKLFWNATKILKEQAIDYFSNQSPFEKLLKQATSNETWNCPNSQLREIARAANDYQYYSAIMRAILEGLGSPPSMWRRLYKCLSLLECMLLHGPERVRMDCEMSMGRLKDLTQVTFYEEGLDRAGGVRQMATRLLELLSDCSALQKERSQAEEDSKKYVGYGHFPVFASNFNDVEMMGSGIKTAPFNSQYPPYANRSTYPRGPNDHSRGTQGSGPLPPSRYYDSTGGFTDRIPSSARQHESPLRRKRDYGPDSHFDEKSDEGVGGDWWDENGRGSVDSGSISSGQQKQSRRTRDGFDSVFGPGPVHNRRQQRQTATDQLSVRGSRKNQRSYENDEREVTADVRGGELEEDFFASDNQAGAKKEKAATETKPPQIFTFSDDDDTAEETRTPPEHGMPSRIDQNKVKKKAKATKLAVALLDLEENVIGADASIIGDDPAPPAPPAAPIVEEDLDLWRDTDVSTEKSSGNSRKQQSDEKTNAELLMWNIPPPDIEHAAATPINKKLEENPIDDIFSTL